MDTSDETTATAENALAALQMRMVFGFVQALLTVAADPKASQIALADLKGQADQIAADRAALDADRAAFATNESNARAELAKEEAKIGDLAKILKDSKERWTARLERAEAEMKKAGDAAYDSEWECLPGGGSRRRDPTARDTPADAHFAPASPDPKFGDVPANAVHGDPRADISGVPFPEHTTLSRGVSPAPARARASRHG